MKLNPDNRKLLATIIAFFISVIPLMLNKAPLLMGDSIVYLILSRLNDFDVNKTSTYPFFINYSNLFLKKYFVLPVILQIFLVFYFVSKLMDSFSISNFNKVLFFLVSLIFTTLFWWPAFLMTDFSLSIMIVCNFLLVFKYNLKDAFSVCSLLVLLFVSGFHLANIPILITLNFIILLFYKYFRVKRSKLILLITLYMFFLTQFFIINLTKDKILPGGSYNFILARISGEGLLEDYLREDCKRNSFEICKYLNYFNNNIYLRHDSDCGDVTGRTGFFLGHPKSPINLAYNRRNLESKSEINKIIINIIKKYPFASAVNIVKGVFRLRFSALPIYIIEKREAMLKALKNKDKKFYNFLSKSTQFRSGNFYSILRYIHISIFCSSLFVSIILFFNNTLNKETKIFLVYAYLALLSNNICMYTLSGAFCRYSARIAWIIPFALILIIFHKGRSSVLNN